MAITATDVKNLREMTGVGMMDCKKALAATDGSCRRSEEGGPHRRRGRGLRRRH